MEIYALKTQLAVCARAALAYAAALVLCLSIVESARAGPLEDSVDRIEAKIETLQTRTAGLPVVIDSVKDVRNEITDGGTSTEIFDEIQVNLGQAKDILEFMRARADGAVSSLSANEVERLITGLENIANIAAGDAIGVSPIDFGILRSILNIAPPRLLALLGRALAEAGIDMSFIERVEQSEQDLVLILEAISQDNAEQSASFFAQQTSNTASPALQGGTRCSFIDDNRQKLETSARRLHLAGVTQATTGEIIAAFIKTAKAGDAKQVGIHGYIKIEIEIDIAEALADMLTAMGSAQQLYALIISTRLQHCENISYQTTIVAQQQEILDLLNGLPRPPRPPRGGPGSPTQ